MKYLKNTLFFMLLVPCLSVCAKTKKSKQFLPQDLSSRSTKDLVDMGLIKPWRPLPEDVQSRNHILQGKYRPENHSPDSFQELVLHENNRFEWGVAAGSLDAYASGVWKYEFGVLYLISDPVDRVPFFKEIEHLAENRYGIENFRYVAKNQTESLEKQDYDCTPPFMDDKGLHTCVFRKDAPDYPFEIQLFTAEKSLSWDDVSVVFQINWEEQTIIKKVDSNGYVKLDENEVAKNEASDYRTSMLTGYKIIYKHLGKEHSQSFAKISFRLSTGADGNYSKVFYLFNVADPRRMPMNHSEFRPHLDKNEVLLDFQSGDLSYTSFRKALVEK